jgi:hypothetical protein
MQNSLKFIDVKLDVTPWDIEAAKRRGLGFEHAMLSAIRRTSPGSKAEDITFVRERVGCRVYHVSETILCGCGKCAGKMVPGWYWAYEDGLNSPVGPFKSKRAAIRNLKSLPWHAEARRVRQHPRAR